MSASQSTKLDIAIEICGSSGDGSIAAGQIFNMAVTHLGYHIMNFDSYPAEIRGFGKSVAHSRVSDRRLYTPGARVDCLIALDDPHSIPQLALLKEQGVVIFDSKPMAYHEEDQAVAGFIEPGMIGYGAPLRELSIMAVNSAKSRNIVALGVMAALFRIPAAAFHHAIAQRFGGKKQAVIDLNLKAFDLGFQFGGEQEKVDPIIFKGKPPGRAAKRESVIISGNEAAARACLAAGLNLYAGYPITPATKIMEILARELPKRGGVVVQTEDEISAIGHIVGAGFAGRRAATATSGPGLCLMTEFLNLAVMAEIPIVVIDSQRAGPSTGLPTKTEQSDLNLAIYGGSGDSPRPVLAPSCVEECYSLTYKAFELAEAYQTPVLVLLDFFLSNRLEDIDWHRVAADDFGTYPPCLAETEPQGPYRRYKFTDSGISPRALPGQEDLYFTSTGLDHNEMGLPDYSAANHQRMNAKRLHKIAAIKESWPPPAIVGPSGELEIGLISWGSSIGAALEAGATLAAEGLTVGGLYPRLLWPLAAQALQDFAKRTKHLFVVEMNSTGQFAALVEQVTKKELTRVCQVYAGPFPVSAILAAIRQRINS